MQDNTLTPSYFPVKEIPVTYDVVRTTTGKQHDVDSGYKLIVRKDTNDVLSCVTNSYKLITNKEIMTKANPILKNQGAVLDDLQMFGNGARVKYKYRFPDIKVKIAKDDYVNPQILINNSYDSSTEVSAMGGAFRILCSNGLVIGFSLGKEGARHTIWNQETEIEKIINSVINKTQKVFDNDFPMMIEKEVKTKDNKKLLEMFPGYTMESMVQYLIANPPKNYWDLLNAATWTSTHVMKRKSEATHKFEAKIFDTVKNMAAHA